MYSRMTQQRERERERNYNNEKMGSEWLVQIGH